MRNNKILLNGSLMLCFVLLLGFNTKAQNSARAKALVTPVSTTVNTPTDRSIKNTTQQENTDKTARRTTSSNNFLKANAAKKMAIAQLVESNTNANVYTFQNTKWNKEGLNFMEQKMNAANIKGLIKAEMNSNKDEIKLHLDNNVSKAERDHIFNALGYKSYQIKS